MNAENDKAPRTTGRPTLYSDEMAARICEQIACGQSLISILKSSPDMPSYTAVMEWLQRHSNFAEQYARAKAEQADYLADQIVSIADSATGNDDTQAKRLQVDARKWIAAKLKPKKYGDHQRVEHSGDESQPIRVVVEHVGRGKVD